MYAYFIIISFLTLISCNEVVEDSFHIKTNERWFATFNIEKINNNYKDLTDIEKPKGTIQPLLRIYYYQGDFKKMSDCLFYKVSRVKDGELTVVKNPKDLDCKKIILNKSYAKITEIQNFGISTENDVLKLRVDEKIFKYKLFNFSKKRSQKVLSSSNEKSILFASPVKESVETVMLSSGKICKAVKDDCSVEFDKCSSCTGGSFNIINSKCPTNYSRVCGIWSI